MLEICAWGNILTLKVVIINRNGNLKLRQINFSVLHSNLWVWVEDIVHDFGIWAHKYENKRAGG